jgi:hypothetical protein
MVVAGQMQVNDLFPYGFNFLTQLAFCQPRALLGTLRSRAKNASLTRLGMRLDIFVWVWVRERGLPRACILLVRVYLLADARTVTLSPPVLIKPSWTASRMATERLGDGLPEYDQILMNVCVLLGGDCSNSDPLLQRRSLGIARHGERVRQSVLL